MVWAFLYTCTCGEVALRTGTHSTKRTELGPCCGVGLSGACTPKCRCLASIGLKVSAFCKAFVCLQTFSVAKFKVALHF